MLPSGCREARGEGRAGVCKRAVFLGPGQGFPRGRASPPLLGAWGGELWPRGAGWRCSQQAYKHTQASTHVHSHSLHTYTHRHMHVPKQAHTCLHISIFTGTKHFRETLGNKATKDVGWPETTRLPLCSPPPALPSISKVTSAGEAGKPMWRLPSPQQGSRPAAPPAVAGPPSCSPQSRHPSGGGCSAAGAETSAQSLRVTVSEALGTSASCGQPPGWKSRAHAHSPAGICTQVYALTPVGTPVCICAHRCWQSSVSFFFLGWPPSLAGNI